MTPQGGVRQTVYLLTIQETLDAITLRRMLQANAPRLNSQTVRPIPCHPESQTALYLGDQVRSDCTIAVAGK